MLGKVILAGVVDLVIFGHHCYCKIVFCNNMQDWIPFPVAWLSMGIIVTDKTNCTKDDVRTYIILAYSVVY